MATDIDRVKRYPLAERRHKVTLEAFGRPVSAPKAARDFLEGLPSLLAGADLKAVVARIQRARQQNARLVFALGAHVVKTGLSPHLIHLMRSGIITDLAVNGAFAIHDYEIALVGKTSEVVDDALDDGSFGFALETGRDFNRALTRGRAEGWGYGESIARHILELAPPHQAASVLATARQLGVAVTVHAGVGTEIIYQHPECDGPAIGELLLRDFRRVTETVASLSGGGWLNIGSAVILPEVLLKAMSVANNLGAGPRDFFTVNLDMNRHYRPDQNVVKRPVAGRGVGYNLIGHHEIMLPLLTWLLT